MDRNLLQFIANNWRSIFLKNAFVVTPVVISIALVMAYGSEGVSLSPFEGIQGNDYSINNVLLMFILASHGVLLISLGLYSADVWHDVLRYRGANKSVHRCNQFALLAIFVTILVIILYFLFVILCCAGVKKSDADWFCFQTIFLCNKILSLLVFAAFFVLDLVLIRSQQKQLRDEVGGGLALFERRRHRNNIRLSLESTIFINVPALFVTIFAFWLSHFLASRAFTFRLDRSFPHPLSVPLGNGAYELFVDGLETGVIVASIFISQIIFAAIKFRWHYRDYIIDLRASGGHPLEDGHDGLARI
jgi:hypothetical protein